MKFTERSGDSQAVRDARNDFEPDFVLPPFLYQKYLRLFADQAAHSGNEILVNGFDMLNRDIFATDVGLQCFSNFRMLILVR